MNIATSFQTYKGFDATVNRTNPWITISRTVDVTSYVYGKPGIIKRTAFNLAKWMMRILSIRKMIKRCFKLFKLVTRIAKFTLNPFFKVAKFITKSAFKLIGMIVKGIFKTTSKVGMKIAAPVIKRVKQALKLLGKGVGKIKSFAGNIIESLKGFVNKRIIQPIKRRFAKILRPIGKVLKWLFSPLRYAKELVGGVTNFVVSKGKAIFSKGKETFLNTGKQLKSFKSGTINFFKEGKNTIVAKITGLGKDAKDLVIRGKDGFKNIGTSAVKWYKKTKQRWRVGFKLLKRAGKKAFKNFITNSRVGKMLAATVMFFVKLFKGLLLKLGKVLLQPVASILASMFAGPTLGLSYLLPLVLGLVIEFLFAKGELLGSGISWARRALRFGKFLLNVALWCVPGGIGALKTVGLTLMSFLPDVAEFFVDNWWEYNAYRTSGLKDAGYDAIITSSTADKINTINDLRKYELTNEILLAKQYTDEYNFEITDIMNGLQSHQINRTNQLQGLNAAFAV